MAPMAIKVWSGTTWIKKMSPNEMKMWFYAIGGCSKTMWTRWEGLGGQKISITIRCPWKCM